jgi:ABC-type nitrate/sulfonate/bicarbonate transport system permease component
MKLTGSLVGMAGILWTFLAWEVIAFFVGPFRLPSPTSLFPSVFTDLTANRIVESQGLGSTGLFPHLLYTLGMALGGTLAGLCVGVVSALVAARWLNFGVFISTIIDTLRSVPPIAAIPFFLLWLGPSVAAHFSVVCFYSAVMIAVSARNAISNLDPVLLRSARTMGAGEGLVVRSVIAPGIVPELVGATRVAFGVAVGIGVVAEYLGAAQGVGQVFSRMVPYQALDVIIAGILWITVLAFVVDKILSLCARQLTKWSN